VNPYCVSVCSAVSLATFENFSQERGSVAQLSSSGENPASFTRSFR
jgi:hypothetical protein